MFLVHCFRLPRRTVRGTALAAESLRSPEVERLPFEPEDLQVEVTAVGPFDDRFHVREDSPVGRGIPLPC